MKSSSTEIRNPLYYFSKIDSLYRKFSVIGLFNSKPYWKFMLAKRNLISAPYCPKNYWKSATKSSEVLKR